MKEKEEAAAALVTATQTSEPNVEVKDLQTAIELLQSQVKANGDVKKDAPNQFFGKMLNALMRGKKIIEKMSQELATVREMGKEMQDVRN